MYNRLDEADAVVALASDYFTAMIDANESELRRIFHPKTYIIGNFAGELEYVNLDEFIASTGDAKTGDRSFDYRVDGLNIVGDTASVTVSGYCYGTWITDQLSMIKINGHWQIVNKIFYAHPQIES